jgi:hypothetical protein
MGQLRRFWHAPGLNGGRSVRTLSCNWSPPLASNDWPVRRGYDAVITYLPGSTEVVFQEKVNETVVVVVEPIGMISVTEEATVSDVMFVAVIVSWTVSKKSP